MVEDKLRKRAKGKLIRVTFPSGKVVCYRNVTNTFVGVLREIGPERFPEINLELRHLPLLSRYVYPEFKEWMKPLGNGWYLNGQSNTDQKYMQLRSISLSLGLDLKIELGDDFETQEDPYKARRGRPKVNLKVMFPDGEVIVNSSPIVTFTRAISKIGVDGIMRKKLKWGSSLLVTDHESSKRQIEVAPNRWVTVPNTTKGKIKVLRVVAAFMHVNLITTIL